MKTALCFVFISAARLFFSQDIGDAEKLSIDFFDAVKGNQTELADRLVNKLAEIDGNDLQEELNNDLKILAFWINIYNTNVQYILKKNPTLFNDRGAFFDKKQIVIAGEILSLDVIEHGILRKSKSKLSLGFFSKISVSKFERKMRIKCVDPRIHYALNCGALSCPPIVPYHSNRVDKELEMSVKDYLKRFVRIEKNQVYVPVLFSWFRADFDGKRGIRTFLVHYGMLEKEDYKKQLKFLEYDWTLALSHYK